MHQSSSPAGSEKLMKNTLSMESELGIKNLPYRMNEFIAVSRVVLTYINPEFSIIDYARSTILGVQNGHSLYQIFHNVIKPMCKEKFSEERYKRFLTNPIFKDLSEDSVEKLLHTYKLEVCIGSSHRL